MKEKITLVSKKDLDISYYKGSGDGGQKRQKTASGVQIIHKESGAIGRCDDTRSQFQNKKKAFQRLAATPKMKLFISKRLSEIQNNKTLDELIDEQMNEKYLKVEKKEDGKWVAYV